MMQTPSTHQSLHDLDTDTLLGATVQDVRNSLGLINADIEQIVSRVTETHPRAAEQLRRALLENHRINSGLSQMLGLYRINQDLLHPALEDTLVLDILEDVCAPYLSIVRATGVSLDVEIRDDELSWVLDPALVKHALSQMLTNAVRYSSSRVKLGADINDNGQLCLRIDDDGQGYPQSLLDVLEPDASLATRTSSTGLGIWFAESIARLHRNNRTGQTGQIQLTNGPHASDPGGRFTLYLP